MGYPTYDIKPGTKDLDYLARIIAENARAKGFREIEPVFARDIALIHSELSEALEEDRKGTPTLYFDAATGKPEGMLAELADVLIRTLETMHFYNGEAAYSIEEIVMAKINHNSSRPKMHGGRAY